MKSIKKIVFLSLLIALEVILTRFLSISTEIVRIGFGFLPIAFAGIILGPAYATAGGALSDLVGFFMFPAVGAYFPGFTFSSALRGFIFGVVHRRSRVTLNRVILSSSLTTIICDLILNTIWVRILTGKTFLAILPFRLIDSAVMIPLSVILIMALWKYLKGFLQSKAVSLT